MIETSAKAGAKLPARSSEATGSKELGVPGGPLLDADRCFHCGTKVPDDRYRRDDKFFCCAGCLTVFELFTENGLEQFYQLVPQAGARLEGQPGGDQFAYLDAPEVRQRLVDFSDEALTRVTFQAPAIHCVACVWLLENLFRLQPGVGKSQVDFQRKTVSIQFDPRQVQLSRVAQLLSSIGYPPEFKLADLDRPQTTPAMKRLHLQIGLAGFAFGNIMLFSISNYFGLDSMSGPAFRRLVGWLSFALSVPVVIFSAADYWRTAWLSLRERVMTIDVPIAAGLLALFGQSTYEVASGRGEGYFDSLCGLLFFLLCGRLFQQKTYHRLAFDRDYRSFFPLSVIRATPGGEERIALSDLRVGDEALLRHGDLIPADARLVSGDALVDYSFVTGEADPVAKQVGEYLYAGGRQAGGVIRIEIAKPVSQSYLTSLWDQAAFRKDTDTGLDNLTNRYSKRFTWIVMAIAVGAAAYWSLHDPARAVKSFTSVLIVACPCALALAAPFTLGTVQRWLSSGGCFVKNATVIERLAGVDTIVFDKTGTLTTAGQSILRFHGVPLSRQEEMCVSLVAAQSSHPLAASLAKLASGDVGATVGGFSEVPGCGIEGETGGQKVWLGSAEWLQSRGVAIPSDAKAFSSVVHVALGGAYRGSFLLQSTLRPLADRLLGRLALGYRLALLSGDQPRERERFAALFNTEAPLLFNQSPMNKLGFVEELQQSGCRVMMVGDGLNDAGALKQSDVGVAVIEDRGTFSPASDVILDSRRVVDLEHLLGYCRAAVRVVRWSFALSSAYNVVGIAIAASGRLEPIVCAILMPLSSISVVAFASGLASWEARRTGWLRAASPAKTELPQLGLASQWEVAS
ncbi:MAG: heavy metal translocating P-type ATPase metal-binding domain-containing protein [Verrucomicrobiales bacterium]|nr:heavy metal translocating P-type ATPase metal-binding domain-containing protein [Verrucomicrobiales bacterium]